MGRKNRVGRCPFCDDPSCKLTFNDWFPKINSPKKEKILQKKNNTMKINEHEYTQEEIFEALRAKGYLLLRYNYTDTDESFPGGVESFEIKTYCALKGADMPSEKNLWENVAIKEFQKEFVKPKLV